VNYIDVFLICVTGLLFMFGWRIRGIYAIVIPASFIAGIFFANFFYLPFSSLLEGAVAAEKKRHLLSYTLVFLIFASLIIMAGIFAAKFFDFFKLAFLDRALGAALLICALMIPLYFSMAGLSKTGFNKFDYRSKLKQSVLFPLLENYTGFIVRLPAVKHLEVIEKILK